MAIIHQSDRQFAVLAATTSEPGIHISDHRPGVFGGRGGRDQEIAFLKGTSGVDDDRKISDVWINFAGTGDSKRLDESRRRVFEENDSF